MHAQIEVVTLAMAKEYLERRLPNRHLSESTAARYASDMREGRWINNGQGIVFDEMGNLIDGQHRCRAIILAQTPVTMLVVRGAPSKAMETMDTGKARTLSDVLQMQGMKNTYVLSATSRICWNYAAGVGFNYPPSKATLLDFVRTHRHLERAVATVESAKRASMVARSPLAAVMALATAGDKLLPEATKFIDGVIHGEGLWKGDPRLTLRNWVAVTRSERGLSHHNVAEPMFAAIIRAWNAFGQGRELQAIKIPPKNVTRDTMDIFGFYQIDWPDVPDRAEIQAVSRIQNLTKAQEANARAREQGTPPAP